MTEKIQAALNAVLADLPGCYPEDLVSLQAFARDTFAAGIEACAELLVDFEVADPTKASEDYRRGFKDGGEDSVTMIVGDLDRLAADIRKGTTR